MIRSVWDFFQYRHTVFYPIAAALFAKGVGVVTILSFMMAVTALSLPAVIMPKRVVKPRLLIVL